MSLEAVCPHCETNNTWGDCEKCGSNNWKSHFTAFQLSSVECKKCGNMDYPPILCVECDKDINAKFFKSTSLGARAIRWTVLTLLALVVFFISFNYSEWNRGASKKQTVGGGVQLSENIASKLTIGKTYKYYSGGSCSVEGADEVCVDKKTFIEICSLEPSITGLAVKMLGQSNSQFSLLSESGVSLSYSIDAAATMPCTIRLNAVGLIGGTSRSITVVAEPANFIINKDGEPFVIYAIYRYAD